LEILFEFPISLNVSTDRMTVYSMVHKTLKRFIGRSIEVQF